MPKKAVIQISTKTGDTGISGLANGQRLAKDQLVFEVVGSLDEVNSWLGVVVAHFDPNFATSVNKSGGTNLKEQLLHIQNTLFYIGAEVAGSPTAQLEAAELTKIEQWSELLQHQLADNWTTKFLLPGGSPLGAWLDVTRTVCRRCERVLVSYKSQATVRPLLLQYMNRLSDYLYLLRCYANQEVLFQERPFIAKSSLVK
jgi:cob(I)alamin adenosyltransferase